MTCRSDRSRRRALALLLLTVSLAACGGRPLVRQYEYEEEMYFDLDGSATLMVNASLAALNTLRGLPVPVDPMARVDRVAIRRMYETPVTRVARVSRPWRRAGRRFIQIRVDVDDVRKLSAAGPFAWSRYALSREGALVVYRQHVGPPAGGAPYGGWTGSELVAFRMHLPSKIQYHNAPSRAVARGNILEWEQPLSERLHGAPLDIEARMESQSILYSTLLVFGGAIVAAAFVVAAAIWWLVRRGRQQVAGT